MRWKDFDTRTDEEVRAELKAQEKPWPEPVAWIFRRFWSDKQQLTADKPDHTAGEVTALYTAEQVRGILAAAIRKG